jgi:hypothetical protein
MAEVMLSDVTEVTLPAINIELKAGRSRVLCLQASAWERWERSGAERKGDKLLDRIGLQVMERLDGAGKMRLNGGGDIC